MSPHRVPQLSVPPRDRQPAAPGAGQSHGPQGPRCSRRPGLVPRHPPTRGAQESQRKAGRDASRAQRGRAGTASEDRARPSPRQSSLEEKRHRGREQARSEPQLPARHALFTPGRREGRRRGAPARSAPRTPYRAPSGEATAAGGTPAAPRPGHVGPGAIYSGRKRRAAALGRRSPQPRALHMAPAPDGEREGGGQAGARCAGTGKGLRDSWRCELPGIGAERWSQLPLRLPRCPAALMATGGAGERPWHGRDAGRGVQASLNSGNRGTCCIPIKTCSMRRST